VIIDVFDATNSQESFYSEFNTHLLRIDQRYTCRSLLRCCSLSNFNFNFFNFSSCNTNLYIKIANKAKVKFFTTQRVVYAQMKLSSIYYCLLLSTMIVSFVGNFLQFQRVY